MVNILLIELVLALYFYSHSELFISRHPDNFVLSPNEIEASIKYFDAQLGWKWPQDTPYGERSRKADSVSQKKIYAIAYGDSFTYGSGVQNDETWPAYLEDLKKQRVLNFGVPAYGVDQSVYRFSLESDKLPPSKFVILGFIDDNLNRNMNQYRAVVRAQKQDLSLTKPKFDLGSNGQLSLVPNPIDSIEKFKDYSNFEFVKNIVQTDWNYRNFRYPDFPYIKTFFRKNALDFILHGKDYRNVYTDPEIYSLFVALLVKFKETAAATNRIPIVIRYPTFNKFYEKNGLLYLQKEKEDQIFLETCRELKIHCLFPAKQLEAEFLKRQDFNHALNGNHYSASGNKKIAQIIFEALEKIETIPATK